MNLTDLEALISNLKQEKAGRLDLADGMFLDGNKAYHQGFTDALGLCVHELERLLT